MLKNTLYQKKFCICNFGKIVTETEYKLAVWYHSDAAHYIKTKNEKRRYCSPLCGVLTGWILFISQIVENHMEYQFWEDEWGVDLAVRKRQGSDWLQSRLTEKPKLPFPRSHCNQLPLRFVCSPTYSTFSRIVYRNHLRRELERCDFILDVEVFVGDSLVSQVVVHWDEPQNVPHLISKYFSTILYIELVVFGSWREIQIFANPPLNNFMHLQIPQIWIKIHAAWKTFGKCAETKSTSENTPSAKFWPEV